MNNKEAMDMVQEYLLKQDPKIVARTAASLLVDMNRLYFIEDLPEEEAICLFTRIALNAREVQELIKNGPTKDFKIIKMNSDKFVKNAGEN